MGTWKRVIVALIIGILIGGIMAAPSEALARAHFLEYNIDNYMVAFRSGNLSASVTIDWPRVIFSHIKSYLSPTFDVSFEAMYLFNDSNGDGYFSRPETTYTSFLDESRVSWNGETGWNITDVTFAVDPLSGESAQFSMRSTVSLYAGFVNETLIEPTVPNWANLTFWFTISEKTTYHSNSYGTYSVDGKTAVRANYSLELLKQVDSTGVVLEQRLKGGGKTYLFELLENHGQNDSYTVVSGRIDETVHGLNYSNEVDPANAPDQEVLFAKEDGTVQAFYRYSSEPTFYQVGVLSSIPGKVSYYTTGTGMVMHTAYLIPNGTAVLTHDMSLGIQESGFVSGPGDWIMDNLAIILFIAGLIVLIPVAARVVSRRRGRRQPDSDISSQDNKEKIQESKRTGDTS